MSKVMNDDVINYLRDKSQNCKFDANEYEPGETFIAKQPLRRRHPKKKKINPAVEERPNYKIKEPQKETTTSTTAESGTATCLDGDDDDCEALKGAGDAGADHVFDDFLAGIPPTYMSQLCVNCSNCNKFGAPIRRILGPFPDEPIMAAVDKILTFLGISLDENTEEVQAVDEESLASEDEIVGLESFAKEDYDTADDHCPHCK